MPKPKMPRVTEPDENLVHYAPDSLSDNVTLCGLTDFFGVTRGEETDMAFICKTCKSTIKAW